MDIVDRLERALTKKHIREGKQQRTDTDMVL